MSDRAEGLQVVHRAGLPSVKVQGSLWQVDQACWITEVDFLDAEGRHLFTRRVDEALFAGDTLDMSTVIQEMAQ